MDDQIPTITAEQAAALRAEFDKKLVKKFEGFDYIDHALVTDRLLQVDPSWSWEPLGYDDDGAPKIHYRDMGERTRPKTKEVYRLFQATMWARLTICGVTRPCVGETEVYPWSDGIEKKLISDMIKNGAMRAGVALDLWSKSDMSVAETPAGLDPEQARDIYRVFEGYPDGAMAAWMVAAQVSSVEEIWESKFAAALEHARNFVATTDGAIPPDEGETNDDY